MKQIALLVVLGILTGHSLKAQEFKDIKMGYSMPDEDFRKAAKKFEDIRQKKIKSALTAVEKAPPVTTATIRRGAENIEIDFADANSLKKVRDFDVIQLNEGVYTQFGNLQGRGLRFIGQGLKKTFVSGLQNNNEAILINGTELWDLSVVHTRFAALGHEGLSGSGIEIIGDFMVEASKKEPLSFAVHTVLSDITLSNLPYPTKTNVRPYERGHANHLATLNLKLTKENYMTSRDSYFSLWVDGLAPAETQAVAELARATAKVLVNDQSFVRNQNEISHKGFSSENLEVVANSLDKTDKIPMVLKGVQRKLLAQLGHYVHEKQRRPANDANNTQYNLLLSKAKAALQKKQTHLGLALLSEADRISFYANHDEIRKLTAKLTANTPVNNGCTVQTASPNAIGMDSAVQEFIYKEMPLLSAPGACLITVDIEEQEVVKVEDKKVVKSEAIYGLTAEAKARKQAEGAAAAMASAAAARAQEKAYKAQILGHSEKMTQIAQKMEAGRLKVSGSGANKVMSYGSGNWGGSVTAATAAQISSNTDEANRLQRVAAANQNGVGQGDLEVKGHEVTTATKTSGARESYVSAIIEGRGPTKKVKGFKNSNTVTQVCLSSQGGTWDNVHRGCTNNFNYSEHLKNHLISIKPNLTKALMSSGIQSSLNKAKANMASPDPSAKLDGMILSLASGASVDAAKFTAEYQKATGIARDRDGIVAAAFAY